MIRKNNSKSIALGGVLSAMSIVTLLGSSFLPLSTYFLPMLSGLMLLPIKEEMGEKTAYCAYFTVSFLSIFIVPEKEAVMMFLFLFGYYPLIKGRIDFIKSKLIRIFVKLFVFNISVVFAYYIIINIFGAYYIMEEFGSSFLLISTLLLGNFAFILYDRALVIMVKFYYLKIRKKLGLK